MWTKGNFPCQREYRTCRLISAAAHYMHYIPENYMSTRELCPHTCCLYHFSFEFLQNLVLKGINLRTPDTRCWLGAITQPSPIFFYFDISGRGGVYMMTSDYLHWISTFELFMSTNDIFLWTDTSNFRAISHVDIK